MRDTKHGPFQARGLKSAQSGRGGVGGGGETETASLNSQQCLPDEEEAIRTITTFIGKQITEALKNKQDSDN